MATFSKRATPRQKKIFAIVRAAVMPPQPRHDIYHSPKMQQKPPPRRMAVSISRHRLLLRGLARGLSYPAPIGGRFLSCDAGIIVHGRDARNKKRPPRSPPAAFLPMPLAPERNAGGRGRPRESIAPSFSPTPDTHPPDDPTL
jgi:hypothetical protein